MISETLTFAGSSPRANTFKKTWLVVTKLDGDEACHMGYVEGAASNANEAAQKLADDFATSFSCKTSKPIIIANSGTVTENIAANDGCQR